MDLTDPTRAVTATWDGPVLSVLAHARKPLTVGEVTAQMPRGSEIGVRRSLARLVEQGIVQAAEMGRNRVHELNRGHVAAPVAIDVLLVRASVVGETDPRRRSPGLAGAIAGLASEFVALELTERQAAK